MPTKTVGYIKLEWTCPNCGTRNPGPEKTCVNCGNPQPENVQFEQTADSSLVTDQAEVKQASAGADIHCSYCGTRNPAGATNCSQCGSDLREGKRRASGAEMAPAAIAPKQMTCANCGQLNAAGNANCSNCGAPLSRAATNAPAAQPPAKKRGRGWMVAIIVGVVALLALCAGALALFLIPSKTVNAQVQAVHWQTVASVEQQQEVHHSDESGSPPSDAYNVSSHTENREVCEDKTVDQGNGYAAVQQVCHDESSTYYSYDVMEWQTAGTYPQEGNDLYPTWADPEIGTGQRRGQDQADYTVTFVGGGDTYTFSPSSLEEFQQYDVGSDWRLKLNALGGIVDAEPAQ